MVIGVTTHPCSEHVDLLARMCVPIVKVVHGGVIFCAVVLQVELACVPEESEFLLQFSAEELVEVNVHGLGFSCNDGLFGHAY